MKFQYGILLIIFFVFSCQESNTVVKSNGKTSDNKKISKKTIPPNKINNKKVSKKNISLLMGQFEPKDQPNFILIDKKYANKSGLYLQKQAYNSFQKMYADAKKDGITLQIKSATRNFNYQKGIWERKWSGQTKVNGKNLAKSISSPLLKAKEILKYSSMPGSSRHHWGTDIDLNSFNNAWFEYGRGKKLYEWLIINAPNYGFCQVYTSKKESNRTGYEEEKWHWSYIPIAKKLTQEAKKHMNASMFKDFKGSETASDVMIVEKYVLGINQDCN